MTCNKIVQVSYCVETAKPRGVHEARQHQVESGSMDKKMSKGELMAKAAKQLADETADVIALIETVLRPGEKLNGLQAMRRYLDGGDVESAAELAVTFALWDEDCDKTAEAMEVAVDRMFDKAMALPQ